jgi:peptidoglycan/xylan/chitin deacetylase (PgdA/CDA1 family)
MELARLLAAQTDARIDSGPGDDAAAWLTAGAWRLFARPRQGAPAGEELQRFALPSGESVAAVRDQSQGRVWVPFDFEEAYDNYVSERWRDGGDLRMLSTGQLRVYYAVKRLIPRRVQLAARHAYTKRIGLPAFPTWPVDDSVLRLLRFYARCLLAASGTETVPFRWFWPRGFDSALILTHDVESGEGLRLALELADLEEERGLRSSFNVVAEMYPVDHGILRELRERGFEIGVHGLQHDRSLFSSRAEFDRQLPGLAEAARSFEATGFRSPSTHRVHDWLGDLPVSYDCSVPHSDPYEPSPGGCCSLWPFFKGSVVELPYTLPQDHTLFTVLRRRSIDVWLQAVDAIVERHGMVQCLSHPDRGYLADPDKRAFYTSFLDAVAERDRLWKPLPRDLERWWRERDGDEQTDRIAYGTIRRGEDDALATLEPPAEASIADRYVGV